MKRRRRRLRGPEVLLDASRAYEAVDEAWEREQAEITEAFSVSDADGLEDEPRKLKPNRDKALSPRSGSFWCDVCDAQLVGPGEKCKRCGSKQLPRRLKR